MYLFLVSTETSHLFFVLIYCFPTFTFPFHPFISIQTSNQKAFKIIFHCYSHSPSIPLVGIRSRFPYGKTRFPPPSAAPEPISLTTLKHTRRSCERSSPATWNSTWRRRGQARGRLGRRWELTGFAVKIFNKTRFLTHKQWVLV